MSALRGGHTRIYRSLLRLYPVDYRSRFGDQMVQLFGDELRDDGPARLWLRTATDLPRSAASEHIRRNRAVAHSISLPPPASARLLGTLGVVGGLVLLAAFVAEIAPDLNILRIFLFLIGGMAVVIAVHQRQAASAPRLAILAAAPALAAGVWLLVMEVLLIARQPPSFGGLFDLVFFWASLAAWLTNAWFGAVAFRLGVVSRVSSAALAVGALLTILGIDRLGLVSQSDQNVFGSLALAGIFGQGVGWILLGLEVALRNRRAPSSPG